MAKRNGMINNYNEDNLIGIIDRRNKKCKKTMKTSTKNEN